MSEQQNGQQLTPLKIPVPPMLEEALDYTGDARYCGCYWERGGDEATYDDGCRSFVGVDPWSFLAYVEHPAVASALRGYDLGSSDTLATHWLVLDRRERQLYIADVQVAQQWLRKQWKWEEDLGAQPRSISADELLQRVKEAMQTQYVSQEEVQKQMRLQQERYQALTTWLEAYC